MSEQIGWKIHGDFITKVVREMLWVEHKPYKDVEELLLGCLATHELSYDERREVARQILSGEKKLEGINSFTLEDDTPTDNHSLYIGDMLDYRFLLEDKIASLESLVDDLRDEIDSLKEDMESNYLPVSYVEENYIKPILSIAEKNDPIYRMRVHLYTSNMIDGITFSEYFGNPGEELKQRFNDFCEEYRIYPGRSEYGTWSWVSFYDKETDKLLDAEDFISRGIAIVEEKSEKQDIPKSDNLEENPEPLSYGWLYPSGKFLKADFGDHEQAAYDIINENHWEDEFDVWDSNGGLRLSRDFLVEVKGFVLLHNPMAFGGTLVTSRGRYTKAQREFLYDYFMADGQPAKANSFISEGD